MFNNCKRHKHSIHFFLYIYFFFICFFYGKCLGALCIRQNIKNETELYFFPQTYIKYLWLFACVLIGCLKTRKQNQDCLTFLFSKETSFFFCFFFFFLFCFFYQILTREKNVISTSTSMRGIYLDSFPFRRCWPLTLSKKHLVTIKLTKSEFKSRTIRRNCWISNLVKTPFPRN